MDMDFGGNVLQNLVQGGSLEKKKGDSKPKINSRLAVSVSVFN